MVISNLESEQTIYALDPAFDPEVDEYSASVSSAGPPPAFLKVTATSAIAGATTRITYSTDNWATTNDAIDGNAVRYYTSTEIDIRVVVSCNGYNDATYSVAINAPVT